MDMLTNREIDVTSFYFNQKSKSCFPRRIELDGQTITQLESGLRRLIRKGQKVIEVFNMTDGFAQYDIQFEPDQRTWTLLRTHAL